MREEEYEYEEEKHPEDTKVVELSPEIAKLNLGEEIEQTPTDSVII